MNYNLYAGASHRNNFDFLRLVLAIMVVYTHSMVVYNGGDYFPDQLFMFSNWQLTFGNVAVNFFFAISGYLIVQSWLKSRSALSYLRKRVFRIYPAFILVTYITLFLFIPLGNSDYCHSWQAYIDYLHKVDFHLSVTRCLKFEQPWGGETFKTLAVYNEVNDSLWSIHFEFIYYLLVLLLGILTLIKKPRFVLALFIIHFGVMMYFHFGNYEWMIKHWGKVTVAEFKVSSTILQFFLAGACYYHYKNVIPRLRWLSYLSPFIFLAGAHYTNIAVVFQLFFGCYALFAFAFSKTFTFYNAAKYGDFSYGIYLFGWPIQQLVMYYVWYRINVYEHFLISLLFIIPFAVFSWYAVEKPFLQFKGLRFQRRVPSLKIKRV